MYCYLSFLYVCLIYCVWNTNELPPSVCCPYPITCEPLTAKSKHQQTSKQPQRTTKDTTKTTTPIPNHTTPINKRQNHLTTDHITPTPRFPHFLKKPDFWPKMWTGFCMPGNSILQNAHTRGPFFTIFRPSFLTHFDHYKPQHPPNQLHPTTKRPRTTTKTPYKPTTTKKDSKT